MHSVDHTAFIRAGMPEAIAVELALQIVGKWISEDRTPDAMRLIQVGCVPAIAEDLAAGVMTGQVFPGEIATLTAWPRKVGEEINAVLHALVAEREKRIQRYQEFRRGVAA